ncbi:MAG: restriction endonuclease [Anaerolineales bacterium]|nr:restriction endonuclease [Anaerolineales bacterium]
MNRDTVLLIALALGAALAALALLSALALRARARRRRPVWRRMLNEMDYFRQALAQLFTAQGYRVHEYWTHQDPLDEAPREVVFALEKAGTLYAALCVRWIVPVTSEVIGRFEKALAATRADVGIIVTTSIFTDAALERAKGLPVELYDRTHVHKWIAAQ